MNLTEEQIRILWDLLRLKESDYPYLESRAAFIKVLEYIYNRLGDDLNLAYLATLHEDSLSERNNFLKILRPLIENTTTKNRLVVNAELLYILCDEVAKTFKSTALRERHANPNNLGIMEKYLQKILTHSEWLTDIDLQRLLTLTETAERIKITRFNPVDIGMSLHFARQSGVKEIGLLVNKGSAGVNQGSHWFALSLKINYEENTVSYLVEDGFQLSPAAREELHKIIHDAINYNVESKVQDNLIKYHAFPGMTITGEIAEPEIKQKDGFSCGYLAA
jgi:hypothetical protein